MVELSNHSYWLKPHHSDNGAAKPEGIHQLLSNALQQLDNFEEIQIGNEYLINTKEIGVVSPDIFHSQHRHHSHQ